MSYDIAMTAKILEDVMQLAESWPESAQRELADLAREIDAELGSKTYKATPQELAAVRKGLKAADEGRFATPEEVERVLNKHRPA